MSRRDTTRLVVRGKFYELEVEGSRDFVKRVLDSLPLLEEHDRETERAEEQSEPREQSPGEGSQNPPDASKGGKERAGG